ncbi:hypothetical protein NQ317_004614, partial [Molorchus minor]
MYALDYSDLDDLSDDEYDDDPIQCYCQDHCPFGDEKGICSVKPGGQCFTSVEAATDDDGYEYPILSYGCLPENEMALLQLVSLKPSIEPRSRLVSFDSSHVFLYETKILSRYFVQFLSYELSKAKNGFLPKKIYLFFILTALQRDLVPHARSKSIKCCSDGDFCNKNLFPMYALEDTPSNPEKLPFIVLVASVTTCVVLLLLCATIFFVRYKKRRAERQDVYKAAGSINGNFGLYDDRRICAKEMADNLNNITSLYCSTDQVEEGGLGRVVQRTISQHLDMASIIRGYCASILYSIGRGRKICALYD